MAKKPRSLNDTAAIASQGLNAVQTHESRSTSVRKIDNGYVTSESSSKDGRYESREYYSQTPPNFGEDTTPNPLRKAVDFMKQGGTL